MRRPHHEIVIPMRGGVARATGPLEVCALVLMFAIRHSIWPAAFLFGVGLGLVNPSDFVELINAIGETIEKR